MEILICQDMTSFQINRNKFITCVFFEILSLTHCFTPFKSELTRIRPNFPRRLISWSGLTTRRFFQIEKKNVKTFYETKLCEI